MFLHNIQLREDVAYLTFLPNTRVDVEYLTFLPNIHVDVAYHHSSYTTP